MVDTVLYILMRNDLESMNPGKAMAQANHAYGALKRRVRAGLPKLVEDYVEWQNQTTQDFGTTITLAGSEREIGIALDRASRFSGGKLAAGWVVDPTYPIRDGEVTHLIELRTCAYLFGKKEDCSYAVGHLALHP